MKKRFSTVLLLMMLMFIVTNVVGCGAEKAQPAADKNKPAADKKGILVVSFGTSYADTCKVTIEACENKIDASFSDYEVRRAFTSNIIRKKLKERDKIEIDSFEEALTKMKDNGFTEVIVQPLHIIPGEEYNEKILEPAAQFKDSFKKLVIGRPILTNIEDYKIAAEALKTQMPELKKDQAVVFMGHGTPHPANACYSCLQLVLNETYTNVFVGTVEGYPALDNIIPKLKEAGIKEVTLMPYMLVAGDHANNDMAGDEEDSWKTILKKEGFTVKTHIHGLGENPEYQDIYVQHVQDCIDGNPMGANEE